MLKILIPIDGSEPSRHAIEAVAELARNGCQLEVALMNVREPPMIYGELPPSGFELIDKSQAEQQEEILKQAEEHARGLGLALLPSRRPKGYPSAEIVREAGAMSAGQIVMGTRGLGAVRSFLIGSVAQRVVHEASVPVLLVK